MGMSHETINKMAARLKLVTSISQGQLFITSRLLATKSSLTPIELSESNLNNFYSISRKDIKSHFPQGLPKQLMNQADTLGKVSWLLREPSWTVIKSLKETENQLENKGKRFLFYGPDRCGKTVSLLQSIHYCLNAGWIVLYIPSVFRLTQSSSEVKQSLRQTSLFDVPGESSLWLQQFKAMNSNHLTSLKLAQDYSWTKNDYAKTGDSLTKVIEQGIVKPNISSDVFRAVFNEMTQLKSHPVLIAVDDLNGCFSPTSFKLKALSQLKSTRAKRRIQQLQIKPNDVTIVQYLLEHLHPNKFSGTVVGALSRRLMRRKTMHSTDYIHLMGEEGKDLASSFDPILVPPYNQEELELCLESYSKDKWLTKEMEKVSQSELWQLSEGVPGELERLCLSL